MLYNIVCKLAASKLLTMQSTFKDAPVLDDTTIYNLQETIRRLEFELSQYKLTQASINSTTTYRINDKIKRL